MWRRIRNLWRLSELEVPPIGKNLHDFPPGTGIIQSLIRPKRATIIDLQEKEPQFNLKKELL